MTNQQRLLSVAALVLAAVSSAAAQTLPSDSASPPLQAPSATQPSASPAPVGFATENASLPQLSTTSQPLFDFQESNIKFSLRTLMSTLRDPRHEGWVLAAYPDPKTKRPLIGAGFSLDLPPREHPQHDPLNLHPFVEPSSAQLWQAAGLEPERLQRILARYDRDLTTWTTKQYRRKIRAHALTPEVTDEEATSLLRISAIQAISNARAYCRGFDQLTASQQMALSHLVFQMGVNLEEFVQFLNTINAATVPPSPSPSLPQTSEVVEPPAGEQWKTVQKALIESQWARLYSGRASSVIAMFDPAYANDPSGAQHRVDATLRPVAVHRRSSRSAASIRTASYRGHSAGATHKQTPHPRRKRKLS